MYKTIVVHVDGDTQLARRAAIAARLAEAFDAHLVGSVATGVSRDDFFATEGSVVLPPLEQDFTRMVEQARAMLEPFAEQMRRHLVGSWEGRVVEEDAREALVLQSRYADLLVLGAEAPAGRRPRLAAGLPEYLALHGVRPVLVVPRDHPDDDLAGTIVVGWDAGMEATRAIGAALPLLQRARSVLVALINPEDAASHHGERPGTDLATYLARHGVPIEVANERSEAGIAPALLGLAREAGANLLVTGIYGHSRYREWIAGGVSRDLLHDVRVPLLLAH